MVFAEIVLPLPIKDTFTFSVPDEFIDKIEVGHRVEVQFGPRKKYAGIVFSLHKNAPDNYKTKPIVRMLDEAPIIRPKQLELWVKVADYYASTLGEVMNAALPAGIKLNSETTYLGHEDLNNFIHELTGDEQLLASAVLYQKEIKHKDLENILSKKNIYPVISSLLAKGFIELKEELKYTYKAKTERIIIPNFDKSNESLSSVLEQVKKAAKQAQVVMYCIQHLHSGEKIRAKALETAFPGSNAAINSLRKKGIITVENQVISRYDAYNDLDLKDIELSAIQSRAKAEIENHLKEKDITLLHGITGSGKTLIYLKLMEEAMSKGHQVLFLVPEIALTTQLVQRMAAYFGNEVSVYHSSIGSNHKIDLWHEIKNGKPLVIGARSSVFLPFKDLKLIIIDEEHDYSYKQNEPTPKYHARETAMFLAQLHQAKVILGSATPSFESYYNALHGKYGLVNLLERYGNAVLPHVELINRNTIEHSKNKGSHFSPVLVNEMLDQLKRGKQSIVFINRRGYSSMLVCTMCEWTKRCKNCDVAMTYHKYNNSFLCHYCGWHKEADPACPECGNVDLSHKGLGTQQIEEELVVLFPEATIARMDFDTVRGKAAMSDMIHRLETGKIDILIGTQMVSKGLDFENIGLVAIVSADQLARFPDFRSHERAFQLMVQVSGRSGRSEEQGKVFIQYGSIRQSLLEDVTKADYVGFYTKELAERKGFIYPPFCRLIKVVIGHRDPQKAAAAMEQFAATMKQHWGSRVVGPAPGLIPRINNQYLFELMLKVERKNEILSKIKSDVRDLALLIKSQSDYKGISCVVDVDPY